MDVEDDDEYDPDMPALVDSSDSDLLEDEHLEDVEEAEEIPWIMDSTFPRQEEKGRRSNIK